MTEKSIFFQLSRNHQFLTATASEVANTAWPRVIDPHVIETVRYFFTKTRELYDSSIQLTLFAQSHRQHSSARTLIRAALDASIQLRYATKSEHGMTVSERCLTFVNHVNVERWSFIEKLRKSGTEMSSRILSYTTDEELESVREASILEIERRKEAGIKHHRNWYECSSLEDLAREVNQHEEYLFSSFELNKSVHSSSYDRFSIDRQNNYYLASYAQCYLARSILMTMSAVGQRVNHRDQDLLGILAGRMH